MEPIILIGGGGHCHSCIDVIEAEGKFKILGIIDSKEKIGNKVLGYEVIGSDDDLSSIIKTCSNFLITVGQIKTASVRKKLFSRIADLGGRFPIICSPRAYVSKHAKIGNGTIILHDVVINANCNVGKSCIINTKALCEHDVEIGDYCHISTGAVINGNCNIGNEVFVGSNSVIKNGISISNNTIVPFGVKYEG